MVITAVGKPKLLWLFLKIALELTSFTNLLVKILFLFFVVCFLFFYPQNYFGLPYEPV